MILQRLYNFSDPEMEEMLYDRFSFRRFCGFGLTDEESLDNQKTRLKYLKEEPIIVIDMEPIQFKKEREDIRMNGPLLKVSRVLTKRLLYRYDLALQLLKRYITTF